MKIPYGNTVLQTNRKKEWLQSSVLTSKQKNLPPKVESYVLGEGIEEACKVILDSARRKKHFHIIGASGSGKSKLMQLLAQLDILNGKTGLCLIDPQGKLVNDLLKWIATECPEERRPSILKRLIVWQPGKNISDVVGFNPLPAETDELERHAIVNNVVSAILKCWGQDNVNLSPRIQKILRNLLYVLSVNNLTLVESMALLDTVDCTLLDSLLQNIKNETVKSFWARFQQLKPEARVSQLEGTDTRLEKFLGSPIIRAIVGQQKQVLDFKKMMKEGQILLVNLNKGDYLTDEDTKLLGALLVTEIFRCAKSRNPHDPKLKPYMLYIDEFSDYVTQDAARILDQTRQFSVFCVLAHQHLSQVKEENDKLFSAVMTNTRLKAVFGGLYPDDAKLMTQMLMTGYYDLQQVKHWQPNTKFAPIETERELVEVSHEETKGSSSGESIEEREILEKTTSTSHRTGASKRIGTAKETGLTFGTRTGFAQSDETVIGTTQRKSLSERSEAGQRQGIKAANTRENKNEDTNDTQSSRDSDSSTVYGDEENRQTALERVTDRHIQGHKQTSSNTNREEQSLEQLQTRMQGQESSTEEQISQRFSTSNMVEQDKREHSSLKHYEDTSSYTDETQQQATTQGKQFAKGRYQESSIAHSERKARRKVPFTVYEKFNEPSPVFYTLEEVITDEMGKLVKQPVGVATIKVEGEKPIRAKIVHIPDIEDSKTTRKKVAALLSKVVSLHPECYLAVEKAKQECYKRQQAKLGTILVLDEEIPILDPENAPEAKKTQNNPTVEENQNQQQKNSNPFASVL